MSKGRIPGCEVATGGENGKTDNDIPLLFVGLILILYAAYCIMVAIAYGFGGWGYASFFLFMAFVFVFIAKGVTNKRRIHVISALIFFVLYVVFIVVALISYGYEANSIITPMFLLLNLACALVLFIKLEWHRKIGIRKS
ncbi:MAG: hypothetical protein U9Q22_05760 [Candidatus Altiarchaeota archaeon]|nr:hypothetical protein [Candidatus Altiarchaeota archaeon]